MALQITENFRKVIQKFREQSFVAKLLLDNHLVDNIIQENHVDFIDISSADITKVSYMTKDRLNKPLPGENPWTSPRRFFTRPGAFVSKVFKDIPSKEIEIFANLFTSFSTERKEKFEIIKGSEIKDYYLGNSYLDDTGSLGNSCMKYKKCQSYFDIYSENDNISLLALMMDGKIIGRALLWEDIKLMDRIYTIKDDEFFGLFRKWAIDNGYIFKNKQNFTNTLSFTDGKDIFEREFKVKLKVSELDRYPYLDTFKWLDTLTGTLYNYKPFHFSERNRNSERVLVSPEGSYEESNFLYLDEIKREYRYKNEIINACGFQTTSESCNFSNTHDKYILKENSKYSDELEDYIYSDNSKNDEEKIKLRIELIKEKRGRAVDARKYIISSFSDFNFHSI